MPNSKFKILSIFLLLFCTSGFAKEIDSVSYYISNSRSDIPNVDNQTLIEADRAVEHAIYSGNDSLLAVALYNQGLIYYYRGFYKASNYAYQKAIETKYAKKTPSFRSKLYNNSGINHDILSEYGNALNFYLKSLDIETMQANQTGIAQSKINIGLTYIWQNKYDDAYRFLKDALSYFEQNPDSGYLGLIYQNMVLYEYHTQSSFNPIPLHEWTEKAEKCFQKTGNWNGLIEVYYNMSKIHNLENSDKSELFWLNKAIQISDDHQIHNSETMLRVKYARLKIANFADKSSEDDILEGIMIIKKHGIYNLTELYYTALMDLYTNKKEIVKLRSAIDEFIETSNLQNRRTQAEMFEELSFLHELKSKENRLNIQSLQLARQTSQTYILVLAIIMVTIISVGSLFFYRYRLNRIKELYQVNIHSIKNTDPIYTDPEVDSELHESSQFRLKTLYSGIVELFTQKRIYSEFEINLYTLANLLNSNEKYISQAIKQESGLSFYHFINLWRINEAKNLILQDKEDLMSLEQIMQKVGFRSRTTFTEAFKKSTGLTPGQFRRFSRESNSG